MTKRKKRSWKDKLIPNLLSAAFVFFVVWAFIAVFTNPDLIFDRFLSAGMIVILYILYKKLGLRLGVILFGFFALLLHHLKLYGNFYYGIPFDRIMHLVAGIALALVIYNALETSDIPRPALVIISIFMAAGVASTMEIIEFIGYANLGSGEGLLFYGKGDFGEYNNVSWDLINNTLGAVIGSVYLFLWSRHEKK